MADSCQFLHSLLQYCTQNRTSLQSPFLRAHNLYILRSMSLEYNHSILLYFRVGNSILRLLITYLRDIYFDHSWLTVTGNMRPARLWPSQSSNSTGLHSNSCNVNNPALLQPKTELRSYMASWRILGVHRVLHSFCRRADAQAESRRSNARDANLRARHTRHTMVGRDTTKTNGVFIIDCHIRSM